MTSVAERTAYKGIVPREGEDGLYTQVWHAVAASTEVDAGKVIGKDFLGGRIVIFRAEDGTASVTSAYCPHMGADLSDGDVVGADLRCAFHHWQFNGEGVCTKTGSGDAIPRNARVFKFPTQEKYGLIWAFNGEQPTYEVPSFSVPEEDLVFHPSRVLDVMAVTYCDPWEFMCNTTDFNRIQVVHGVTMDDPNPVDSGEWEEWGFTYPFRGTTADGMRLDFKVSIVGTNVYREESEINGRRRFVLNPCTPTKFGQYDSYSVIGTLKGDTPEEMAAADEYNVWSKEFQNNLLADDVPIMNKMRFRPEMLTKSDLVLGRYLRFLRDFPRAHPARDFIS